MFQMKTGKEAFMVVEGLFKGRSFKPGQVYAEIPPQEAGKFTEIQTAAPPAGVKKTAKEDSKRAFAPAPLEKGGGKS